MRRAYGPEHPDVVYATGSLGRNQYYLGRSAEAERNLRWALSVTDPDGAPIARGYGALRPDPGGVAGGPAAVEGSGAARAQGLAIQDSLKDTLARVTAGHLATIYDATGRAELAAGYRQRAEARP